MDGNFTWWSNWAHSKCCRTCCHFTYSHVHQKFLGRLEQYSYFRFSSWIFYSHPPWKCLRYALPKPRWVKPCQALQKCCIVIPPAIPQENPENLSYFFCFLVNFLSTLLNNVLYFAYILNKVWFFQLNSVLSYQIIVNLWLIYSHSSGL